MEPIQEENYIPQIPPGVSLELFLCNLKLYRDTYSFFKLRGVKTLEQLINFRNYPQKQTPIEKKRFILIQNNLRAIRDELPKSDLNAQILYLINKPIVFESSVNLKGDLILKEFKNSTNVPNYCLPTKFQSQNLKHNSLYSSNLTGKRIGKISIEDDFINLKQLYLDDNRIQKIENLNLPNLEILSFANNYIRKIENLENLPNLQNLNVSNNLIQIFEGVGYNQRLQEIDLSNQYIPKFINFVIRPQCVAPNNIIQNINLENCNIIDPKGLVQFPYLRILNLKENSIYEMMDVLTVCKACIYLENINVLKNPFIQENKTTYRNFIIIACKNLNEIDEKEITNNEKVYVNNLFMRKYAHTKEKKAPKPKQNNLSSGLTIQHVQREPAPSMPNPYDYYKYGNNYGY